MGKNHSTGHPSSEFLEDFVGVFSGVDNDDLASVSVGQQIAVGLDWSDYQGGYFQGHGVPFGDVAHAKRWARVGASATLARDVIEVRLPASGRVMLFVAAACHHGHGVG